jgi:hypothetical protein
MDAGAGSSHFRYDGGAVPIRADLPEAHRRAWSRIASPGACWRGDQRVAIAAEVRAAESCGLCLERKAAVSAAAVTGSHDSGPESGCLPEAAIDAVHRVTTNAGLVTRSYIASLADQGVSDAAYVELVGVAVTSLSIDRFHQGLGLELEPLPEPEPGEPSGYRPPGAKPSVAYVPMISARDATGAEADLYDGLPNTANVLSALSLVPDAVRQLDDIASAQYLPRREMLRFDTHIRAISRAQIELLAGRVSALNECFY